jgi:hypothetical protein
MMLKVMIVLHPEKNTKSINTLCVKDTVSLNVKTDIILSFIWLKACRFYCVLVFPQIFRNNTNESVINTSLADSLNTDPMPNEQVTLITHNELRVSNIMQMLSRLQYPSAVPRIMLTRILKKHDETLTFIFAHCSLSGLVLGLVSSIAVSIQKFISLIT